MGRGSSSPTAAASLHPHPLFVFKAPTLLFFLLLVTRPFLSSCLSATAADHDRSSHHQTTSTGSPTVSDDQEEDIKAENFEYFIHHRPAPQPAEQQYYHRRAHQQPRPGVEHKPYLLPRGDHASRSRQQQQRQAQCEYTVTIRTSCSSPDAGVDCNARIQLVFTDNLGHSVTVNNNLQGKCGRCSVLDISVRAPCLDSICALNLFHDARDDWTPLYVMVSRSDAGHPPVLFCVDKPLPQKRFSYSDCGRDLAALPTGASNVAIFRTIVDAAGIRRDDDGGCADVGVYVRG